MKFWYQRRLTAMAILLWPLSALVAGLVRWRIRQRKSGSYPKPVLVVGNISVGGTGKSPAIQAIALYLQQQGWRCGVVSRGYGGQADHYPLVVTPDSKVEQCGDEPLMLARQLNCPLVVDPDRHRAVTFLLDQFPVDLVISDDGLQHYRMGRDLEWVMIDGARGLGNGLLLPAGPLREPVSRLKLADWVIAKQEAPKGLEVDGVLKLNPLRPVNNAGKSLAADQAINACAGIGNTDSFVKTLTDWGYQIHQLAEPGDHRQVPASLLSDASRPLVITEKDAVKLSQPWPDHCYVVRLQPSLPVNLLSDLEQRLRSLKR